MVSRLCVWIDSKLVSELALARFYLADTRERIWLAWAGKNSLAWQGKAEQTSREPNRPKVFSEETKQAGVLFNFVFFITSPTK